ncbi:MAG: PASTA domain-containing protein, partial [Micromonospora sp.]
TIPSVVGNQYDNVKEQLEGLGLKVKRDDVNNGQPEGTVTDINPAAGQKVAENSTITVKVSKGNVAQVPDVVGFSKDQAIKALKAAGYKVEVRNGDEVPAAEAGKVTSQDPKDGTDFTKGKTVTIEVTIPLPEESPTPEPSATSPSPTTSPTAPGGGGGWPIPTTPPA